MKKQFLAMALCTAVTLFVGMLAGCAQSDGKNTGNTGTPPVFDTITAANESQAKSDAATLCAACKDMYSEVVSGTLNASSSHKPVGVTLPAAAAAPSAKRTTAQALKISDVIKYADLQNLEGKIGDFVYSTSGIIYASIDSGKPADATNKLTLETTMKELGFN